MAVCKGCAADPCTKVAQDQVTIRSLVRCSKLDKEWSRVRRGFKNAALVPQISAQIVEGRATLIRRRANQRANKPRHVFSGAIGMLKATPIDFVEAFKHPNPLAGTVCVPSVLTIHLQRGNESFLRDVDLAELPHLLLAFLLLLQKFSFTRDVAAIAL